MAPSGGGKILRRMKFTVLLAGLASLVLSTPPAVQAQTTSADAPDTAKIAAPQRPTNPGATPSDPAALGGYNVLIADRGNNRLIIVSPEKKILWEYRFHGLAPGDGADDAFFADNGTHILASVEHGQIVEVIDRATKKVIWQYGHINQTGWKDGYLNFPDDAYRLPNGNVIVADIRNCRILEISPDKKIVRQAGKTLRCKGPGTLASPNGDKPLENGHILVSTIQDHGLVELDQNWQPILHLTLPIHYPSDPQPTKAGNIVVAGYTNPGHIIILDRTGKVLWDYKGVGPQAVLNRPSLAMELPNGNIMATDDLNARIVVIDRATQKIVWQYGVYRHAGSAPGYLRIPDGLDIIKAAPNGQN